MTPRYLPILVAGLAVALSAISSTPTMASHYRLSSSFSLLAKGEFSALQAAEIRTTEALLKATAKRRGRATLARATGIPAIRLHQLAEQCDLLRVTGLGPSAVQLLNAAKILDTTELGRANAGVVHARLEALKSTSGLPKVAPTRAEVERWVRHARSLRPLLEGAR